MNVDRFFIGQLADWHDAANRYSALECVKVKQLGSFRVQFNPSRIVSTGAKVDAATIGKRPCFLCKKNRPECQQAIEWGGGRYEILVNPFPIFPHHFTIAATEHVSQRIDGRIGDMLRLAVDMPGYTVFYNGAHCGASAPDHMHFQAVETSFLPIWEHDVVPHLRIDSPNVADVELWFGRISKEVNDDDMNLLCKVDGGEYSLIVIPRRQHRPSFYGDGDNEYLVSPASIDLGGVIVTPREKDFERINVATIERIVEEVCFSREEINELKNRI